jgi:GNAT superfamily N-acetyltransferase
MTENQANVTVVETRYFVRRAGRDDIDKLVPLWKEAVEMLVANDHRFSLNEGAAAQWAAATAAALDDEACVVFVAESRANPGRLLAYLVGKVTAAAALPHGQPTGVVCEIAIDFHARMGGIGTFLLTAFKGWLRERGVSCLEAHVPARHAIAQAFWRALGAAVEGQVFRLNIE